jgi:hypothetical protein
MDSLTLSAFVCGLRRALEDVRRARLPRQAERGRTNKKSRRTGGGIRCSRVACGGRQPSIREGEARALVRAQGEPGWQTDRGESQWQRLSGNSRRLMESQAAARGAEAAGAAIILRHRRCGILWSACRLPPPTSLPLLAYRSLALLYLYKTSTVFYLAY